jgi:hypothetical protein
MMTTAYPRSIPTGPPMGPHTQYSRDTTMDLPRAQRDPRWCGESGCGPVGRGRLIRVGDVARP